MTPDMSYWHLWVFSLSGHRRLMLQMAGVEPSSLLFEVLGCPYCAQALENIDLDLADSDCSQSEGEVVHEFSHRARFRLGHLHHHKRLEERSRLIQCWEDFRDRMKRIVDSKYFNRGIMIAILINTLSMGIEYHEQVSARMASFLLVAIILESLMRDPEMTFANIRLICFTSQVVSVRLWDSTNISSKFEKENEKKLRELRSSESLLKWIGAMLCVCVWVSGFYQGLNNVFHKSTASYWCTQRDSLVVSSSFINTGEAFTALLG